MHQRACMRSILVFDFEGQRHTYLDMSKLQQVVRIKRKRGDAAVEEISK